MFHVKHEDYPYILKQLARKQSLRPSKRRGEEFRQQGRDVVHPERHGCGQSENAL
jgi:hypothetical protein